MKTKHHFFGKECAIDRELANRDELKRQMHDQGFIFDHLLFVNQIHSSEVVVIDSKNKIYPDTPLPKADALVTNLSKVALAIVTADCAPILFFDERAGVAAAAHAGWRGAKLGIIKRTVGEMKKLGATAQNIQAIIGPTIAMNSYEVGDEFYEDFLRDEKFNQQFFTKIGARWHFDLPEFVKAKLAAEEVSKIIDLKVDTYTNRNRFHCYRYMYHQGRHDKCGRNISVIQLLD